MRLHLFRTCSMEMMSVLKAGIQDVWIGYRATPTTGGLAKWKWVDGSEWDYTNWYTDKPGPASSGENKLELLVGWGDSFWNDVSNVHPLNHGFICQRETSVEPGSSSSEEKSYFLMHLYRA